MALTGILLRTSSKAYFDVNPPQEGEIVYTYETDEIGILNGDQIIWQNWDLLVPYTILTRGNFIPVDSYGQNGDKYIFTETIGSNIVIREYKKANGTWTEISWGATLEWILASFEQDINDFLGQRNDFLMSTGYVPLLEYDIAIKSYLDSKIAGSGFVPLNGSSGMDVGYKAVQSGDVMTGNAFLQGDINYSVPKTDPRVLGALWYNNGVLAISTGV